MKLDVCIEVCRTIFAKRGWRLLKNGTVFVLTGVERPAEANPAEAQDKYTLNSMTNLAVALGPYNGEGSSLGDCDAAKLLLFPGWLVTFGDTITRMITYVGPEEMEGVPSDAYSPTEVFVFGTGPVRAADPSAPLELRVALFGRYKRNLDARKPEIVARSEDKIVGGP